MLTRRQALGRRGDAARRPHASLAGVWLILTLLAMTLFFLLTGSPSPGPTVASGQTTPASSGRNLYLRDCAWCHGNDGEGTPRGPSLIGVGAADADFMLSTGRMPISGEQEAATRKPPAYPPEEIRQLSAYIQSLGGGPPIPRVNRSLGNLTAGEGLYEENCAACHSSAGIGGALPSGFVAPSVLVASPVQIAEAVRLGPTSMPRFGSDVISDRQLDSIIVYIDRLRNPRDRGGAGLGHLGPVAEGFVAWAVGLLAIVLIVRWIGTRSPA
jgi:ubiquinol-cytochrome c reductase cytochrome c subunit